MTDEIVIYLFFFTLFLKISLPFLHPVTFITMKSKIIETGLKIINLNTSAKFSYLLVVVNMLFIICGLQ